ncbi:4-hydroxy-tetrahydrodipicolinate synthase [Paraneptunicella aestuarii]|uniref:4-hydroxy-tetrahydrodipicolinate synthase n=1 Tax=Paraneptunicella aestuarii TaxID=2831148 RepID=UPI001E5FEBA5|nr:4-hydroxy-tetrahydrodipicolinate synthase [Paraneptunicella aestuarii]UAA40353.1 4-hydroxy-tetrahydrodipicolinate synthase [Paraneptunicella aestuarii]
MFKGSIVALITPMTPSGDVDYASLQKLVQFHIENGTDAIVSVGTTGESATLPVEEHIKVVEKTVEFSEGKIPVIAGTGANSTQEAIELGDAMKNSGVKGFLSVVPYYNKPQQRGMIAHFNAIADAAPVPVLLYNVPSRTVADLSNESVAELAKHPNIVGIKDATGDLARLADLKPRVPDDFVILSGDDPSGCDFLCAGGDGVISVTANIVPAQMKQMCDAARNGDSALAHKINDEIAELHTTLFIEPNPVVPKWVLYKMGLTQTPALRLPMVEPEPETQNTVMKLLQGMGIVA